MNEYAGDVAAKRPRRLRTDLRVLWHLLMQPVRGKTHAERLESFYRNQADDYDSFRSRLLHGRDELFRCLDYPKNGVWVDLGAGTGQNVLAAGHAAEQLSEIHLVDLSPSLLRVAEERMKSLSLTNVRTHLADATEFSIDPGTADLVTFSYSLTMIPDWFEAITRAEQMLKPGGMLAVIDFYVSRKYAEGQQRQHGWLRRAFWTHWFAADNVFLSGDHVAMLHRRFSPLRFEQSDGKVPYLPVLRAPYYCFIGRKAG